VCCLDREKETRKTRIDNNKEKGKPATDEKEKAKKKKVARAYKPFSQGAKPRG